MDSLHAHHKQRHEPTKNLSTSTLQTSSSSRLGQALDQHSIRLVLQCLERLEMLGCRVHEEIQEIRSLFVDLLGGCQSDIAMEESGGYDSTIDSQTGLDGPNAIPPSVFSHGRCFVPQSAPHETSWGATGSLSEGTGPPQGILPRSSTDHEPAAQFSQTQPQYSMYPEACSAYRDPRVSESSLEGASPRIGQLFRDLSLPGTSDHAYKPAVQPFQGFFFEGHDPLGFSAKPNELSDPVVQTSQVNDKIKCTLNGCSAFIKKGSLTRHRNEVHEGRIKAACAGCGKKFKRLCQMNDHILRYRCGGS